MSAYLKNIGTVIYNQFPQNVHSKQLPAIESQEQALQTALNDKAGATFDKVINQIYAQLESKRLQSLKRLDELNGLYFQDPNSQLKQAWDLAAQNIKLELNVDVSKPSQLPGIILQLQGRPVSPHRTETEKAIARYNELEQEKLRIQTELTQAVSLLKTGPKAEELLILLTNEKSPLEGRQKELCGSYNRDPNSHIDQAWKKYELAHSKGTGDADELLEAYRVLEIERSTNETRLYSIFHQLSIVPSSERTIEVLSLESIESQLKVVRTNKANESKLAGIDWTRTAIHAVPVAIIVAAAFIGMKKWTLPE